MKLSIIIPVYRTQDTLERCLESILQQSFTDYEMILVDDGSDDGSPQLCDEYARKDARIRVIHKENGGLSDARNAGIREARGEYITFVDSDDTMVDNTLENLIQEIQQHPMSTFWSTVFQRDTATGRDSQNSPSRLPNIRIR